MVEVRIVDVQTILKCLFGTVENENRNIISYKRSSYKINKS